MIDTNDLITGYTPAILALLLVFVYFLLVSLMLRAPGRKDASVARYQPPLGASPAVAAWLCERGRLPRAMAAAIVNMAAKGYLEIGQIDDLVSLTKLAEGSSAQLEPEEDALSRLLFQSVDYFEFVDTTAQLAAAAKAFRWALLDTEYFSPHTGLSAPAWAISGVAMVFAFFQGGYFLGHGSFRILEYAGLATFGGFVLAIRTLSGTIEKIGSRIPAAPRRSVHGPAPIPGLSFFWL